ncbi:MAG TPA: fumarylacetoacetase [Capsulimonadaceae bacterium]|nr:fumarylacetoacetase [Capsulimonadaceae bacterium]
MDMKASAFIMDSTHDPNRKSWVQSANRPECDFPIQNLPYASFRKRGEERVRVAVAIGDMVLDASEALGIPSLLAIMSMPRRERTGLRLRLSELLANYSPATEHTLLAISDVELLLPCDIPDYTDFFASIDHATNVGRLFRPDQPLAPNYKWIPIAYHGRASSIVPSGTPVRRPNGQILPAAGQAPILAPSRMLDYELELGAFLGPGNPLGQPIPIAEAEDHLFGVCLLNDWSARDIQSWESHPLGPFLSKSFATSLSPWIVTLDALEPFRTVPPARPPDDPQPLPYLRDSSPAAFRITLEVCLRSAKMPEPVHVSQSDFASLYWTLSQMIAHHSSNGCNLRPGGLIGSGTVSGPSRQYQGCLLELTRRGADPLGLPSGETRAFLEDGDEVILKAWCEASGFRRIGLGECRGLILPALSA